MRLIDLLNGLVNVEDQQKLSLSDIEVSGMALDSREVEEGYLFIALSGAHQHGLSFADKAITKGACAVLFDPAGEGSRLAAEIMAIPVIPVVCLNVKLGDLAARFYGDPSRKLEVIGITGTNGKTSCSQFLGQVLDECGIIGTLGWGSWGRLNKTINTTPDALSVQQMLAKFVEENKRSVAMEVSSHGLDQGRVNGVRFKGAVYTNISRDHLDYHGTMESYLAAKLKLLQMNGLKFVVINLDDANSKAIIEAAPSSVELWGISTKGNELSCGQTVIAKEISHTPDGIEFDVCWAGNVQRIKAPLYGDFNAENLLCVLAVMLARACPLPEAAKKLTAIKAIRGRMERCGTAASGLNVFVDYAHTPDALYRVLTSLRKHSPKALWVVFGCGGNRDVGKRPEMGRIAEQFADQVIVTDDNPRFENNVEIARAILSGCKMDKAMLIQDRKEAIHHAIANAAKDDCIVVAGKGHETYQEISGTQYPFNDRQIAEEALSKRFGLQ